MPTLCGLNCINRKKSYGVGKVFMHVEQGLC
jgi:hypothetical protein